MSSNFYVLILAGGKGTRLWPKSKKTFPKHILSLHSRYSLLEETYRRVKGFVPGDNIFVITLKKQAKTIKRQLPFLDKENLIIEPEGKDTLPSILLGTIIIKKKDPHAIVCVLPSDHVIKPRKKFLKILMQAKKSLKFADNILTIGVKPTYPATEYGYIKISSTVKDRKSGFYKVDRFVEKPSLIKAKVFFRDKSFFWNAGIFIFRADKIMKETEKFYPRLYKDFMHLIRVERKKEFNLTLKRIYAKISSTSIDKAIMEKSGSLNMLKANFLWFDLGNWETLANILRRDINNNVGAGERFLYKTNNSIVINEEKRHLIVTLGLDNMIVVHTPQASLICPKSQTKELKNLVNLLEQRKIFRRYL
ncbi:MAG: mannose-1-phosphate guanylyltransferase [Candidatus Omnitrophota bacterium]